MITARVTNVNITPQSGINGFHVEIAWRYGTSGNFVVAAANALVNKNGTLPIPVNITYNELTNPTIQIRVTYRDAIGCTPYYYSHTGTAVTTTSTVAPATTTTSSTTSAPTSTTTSTTASGGSTTTTTTGTGTTTSTTTSAPTTTTTTTAAPASTTTTTTVAVASTISWGWTSEDPYDLLQSGDITYSGTQSITPGQAELITDFHSMPVDSYPVLRVPAVEPVKTQWFESNFNYGQIPDQVFRASFVARGYRYYVGRIPMTFDPNVNARVKFS